MANPQTENGYIRIATEIYTALCKIRINGEARQVLDFIIRKTYGFNKRQDAISLSQFSLGTGLKRPTICKAIAKLKKMNLIIITQKDNTATIFRFNKDFDTWEALPKKITLPKKVMSLTQKDNEPLPKKIHTIDKYTKDNNTKDITHKTEEFLKETELVVKDKQVDLEEIKKFCSYWTEPNKSQTKLRWELQPTFDIGRRLGNWMGNAQNFNNKRNIKEL